MQLQGSKVLEGNFLQKKCLPILDDLQGGLAYSGCSRNVVEGLDRSQPP